MNALDVFQILVLCVIIVKILYKTFFMTNTNIENRLAYLVQDIIEQEYAQLVMAVVAVFGIQLIEPFHAVTISKTSTHKSLQVFLQELYCKMLFSISEDFSQWRIHGFQEYQINFSKMLRLVTSLTLCYL